MLLGLLAAVMLAVLLQLNATRSRRAGAFEFAADGIIHLRCWVVVETTARVASRPVATLALAAPVKRPEPLKFVGEMRMVRRSPVRRPNVRMPPDAIIIPSDILAALARAGEINASIWQSPPGLSRAAVPLAAALN